MAFVKLFLGLLTIAALTPGAWAVTPATQLDCSSAAKGIGESKLNQLGKNEGWDLNRGFTDIPVLAGPNDPVLGPRTQDELIYMAPGKIPGDDYDYNVQVNVSASDCTYRNVLVTIMPTHPSEYYCSGYIAGALVNMELGPTNPNTGNIEHVRFNLKNSEGIQFYSYTNLVANLLSDTGKQYYMSVGSNDVELVLPAPGSRGGVFTAQLDGHDLTCKKP